MYYIRKYADSWAIHNDETGNSRELTAEERAAAMEEHPALRDNKVNTVFVDNIHSIQDLP